MEEEDEGSKEMTAPAWMATFGDMMSLLLTFFVLLLSFANMDIVRFRQMIGSVQDALGVKTVNVGPNDTRSATIVELSELEATPVMSEIDPESSASDEFQGRADSGMKSTSEEQQDRELYDEIQRVVRERALHSFVEAVPGERGVTIRVRGEMLFESGSDTLRLAAEGLLYQIADLARAFPYKLAVEGHTDDQPIRSDRIPTNWHLSAYRAIAGVRFLAGPGEIDPSRLSATGYGSTRPIARGASPESRSQNRRLEFVFYRAGEGTAHGKPDAAAAEELALPGFDL